MEIRGEFSSSRPIIRAAVAVGSRPPSDTAIVLVIDTGADTSVLMPDDYQAFLGVRYEELLGFPVSPSFGFGGAFTCRRVPLTLIFETADGPPHVLPLNVDMARPTPATHGIPSVLGRDVLDRFRLTIDRSIGLIALTDAEGDLRAEFWPDGEPREHD